MQGLEDLRQGLDSAAQEALAEIRTRWRQMNQGPGAIESFKGFVAAVDWSEPWLIALLALEALLLVLVVYFRKQTTLQGCVLAAAGFGVYNAERLNRLLGQHWHRFARQPYFDAHGVFISTTVSAPLLLAMFLALVNYLVVTSKLLVEMKRKELRFKSKQQRQGVSQEPKKTN